MGRALSLLLFLALLAAESPAGEPPPPLAPEAADETIQAALRLLEAGLHQRSLELAEAFLDHPSSQASAWADNRTPEAAAWLARRETARFILARDRFGLAETRDDYLAAADEFLQLAQNRYRIANPAHAVQSSYWAGRAYQAAEEYGMAADQYRLVGGTSVPQDMEGDAAERRSKCLHLQADGIPHPGSPDDQRRRSRLLTQATEELERARISFPSGKKRKELDLELISFRLSWRENEQTRIAIGEIDSFLKAETAKDDLRARAVVYRAQAQASLGNLREAVDGFNAALKTENPEPGDRRAALLGLGLALREQAEASAGKERTLLIEKAADAFARLLADAGDQRSFDRARLTQADILLELGRPAAAMEVLEKFSAISDPPAAARLGLGLASMRLGRRDEAYRHLYSVARSAGAGGDIRERAAVEAAKIALAGGDFALAVSLEHRAEARMRKKRDFPRLTSMQFAVAEQLVRLAPLSVRPPSGVSEAMNPVLDDGPFPAPSVSAQEETAANALGAALGGILGAANGPGAGYDASVQSETLWRLSLPAEDTLKLSLRLLAHLRARNPGSIPENALNAAEGKAGRALAAATGARFLERDRPDEQETAGIVASFSLAGDKLRDAAAAVPSAAANIEYGLARLETASFLLGASERWGKGPWAGSALNWRDEAKRHAEASLPPLERAMAESGRSGGAYRRALWAKSSALDMLEERRQAADGYAWLMGDSGAPETTRIRALQRWAKCMDALGESAATADRLAAKAEQDAETAMLAGEMAEKTGDMAGAHRHYLMAADPAAKSVTAKRPDLAAEAAYKAGRVALGHIGALAPGGDGNALRGQTRRFLENAAYANLAGEWTAPILDLLGEDLIGESPDGWKPAYDLAARTAENRLAPPALKQAMHFLAAKALFAGKSYPEALDELDSAIELAGTENRGARAEALFMTARVYAAQERWDDALRVFTDVFAAYPEMGALADRAKLAAAETLLLRPDPGAGQSGQAESILSGVSDRDAAEALLRRFRPGAE